MPRAPDRFLSRAQAGLARRAHAYSWRGITPRPEALRRGSVSERMRQDEFRHARTARAFQRLEGHDDRRRHCVDADRQGWTALRG